MQLHVVAHVINHRILQKLNKNLVTIQQPNHAVNQKTIALVLKVKRDLLISTSQTIIAVKNQVLAQNQKVKAAAKAKHKPDTQAREEAKLARIEVQERKLEKKQLEKEQIIF